MCSTRYEQANIADLNKNMDVLDGIRGIAILLVLVTHTVSPTVIPGWNYDLFKSVLHFFAKHGLLGVDLFFVLSGFLITGILLRTKANTNYFSSFYFRRMLRIFPLYYVFITIILFVVPILIPYLKDDIDANIPLGRWVYFLYLQNIFIKPNGTLQGFLLNPMWSLAIEEQFYLIWPIIVYCFDRTKLLAICISLAIFSVVLRLYLHNKDISGVWLTQWPVTRLDGLIIGSILSIMIRSDTFSHFLQKNKIAIFVVSLLAAISVIICNKMYSPYTNLLAGFSVFPLFFASIINALLFCNKNSIYSKIFDNRLLRAYGRHSYAIYIIQMPVIGLTHVYFLQEFYKRNYFGSLVMLLIVSLVCLSVSWIIWHLIERPFLNMKKHFVSSEIKPHQQG